MNLLTIHDFEDLFYELKRSPKLDILSRFVFSRKKAIVATWDRPSFPRKNWNTIKRVVRYHNRLATGNPDVDFSQYAAQKYLRSLEPLKGLSVGCGKGSIELNWAKLCTFKEFIGVDLAPRSIETANTNAKAEGHNELQFRCGNICKISYPDNYFDVTFAQAALHHFKPVDRDVEAIYRMLKPNGLFIVSEYVGPNRLQWTKTQLKIVNNLLAEIPERYRKRWKLQSIKTHVYRRGILRMLLSDPSEAIESEAILPAIERRFETVELIKRGGTILHPLLHDIGCNFMDGDNEADAIIDHLLKTERELIDNGTLGCDFIIGVFRKPAEAP